MKPHGVLMLPPRPMLLAAAAFLGMGIVIGFATAAHGPAGGSAVVRQVSSAALFGQIAANNLVAVVVLLTGLWTGGASAGIGLVVNGFKIARLLILFRSSGVTASGMALILGLHGWIEISVMLIAGAYGLQGYERLAAAFGSDDQSRRRSSPPDRFTLCVLATALLVAAAIEAWVSQRLAMHFLPAVR